MSAVVSSGPDQAVGWLIASACFCINFIMAGIARSVGVLFVALIELYGVSRETATTPFSIRCVVRNMTGPLIGLLGLKYGIRNVTTMGGFVAGLGIILCYFAPDVTWITVFWGVIHGFGFGLATVIHMMIISQYFDKYRATALAFAFSGDCFGTFAFPAIMEHFLSTYDLRGTFLLLGGILLHVIPMAMLLRKPPWLKSKKKSKYLARNIAQNYSTSNKSKNKDSLQDTCYRNEAFLKFDGDLEPFDDHSKDDVIKGETNECKEPVSIDRVSSFKSEIMSRSGSFQFHRKLSELSELKRENIDQGSLPPVFEKDATDSTSSCHPSEDSDSFEQHTRMEEGDRRVKNSDSFKKKRAPSIVSQMAHDFVHRVRSASFASQVAQDGFIGSIHQESQEDEECPISGILIREGELIQNEHRGSISNHSIMSSELGKELMSTKKIEHASDIMELPPSHWVIHPKEEKEPTLLQTVIRTNMKPIFILISVSMAAYAYLFVAVFTVIIDYAVDQGVSQEEGKYLIIAFSVADLIGRLIFGQILDRKLMKIKNYSGVTLLLIGILVASLPLNTSFNFMLSCMSMFGFVQGGTAIMFPILVNFYMEKNEESVAMGCVNFYGGFLLLTMSPMIGYFRDNIGSYNPIFYIIGGAVAVVGLIWQLEPLILKFQNKQMLKRANFIIVTKL